MAKANGTATTTCSDIYDRITKRIVEQLEAGTRPWMQPWGACGTRVRPLRHNGIAYRGINTVLLWMTAAERGYNSRYWMTFRQTHELGANVRKLEKSTLVVYANGIERKKTDDEGEEIECRIPLMKGFSTPTRLMGRRRISTQPQAIQLAVKTSSATFTEGRSVPRMRPRLA